MDTRARVVGYEPSRTISVCFHRRVMTQRTPPPPRARCIARPRARAREMATTERALDWRAIAVVQCFSMSSTAATTALFSIGYFMCAAFARDATASETATRAGALVAAKPLASAMSAFAFGRAGDRFGYAIVIALSGFAHACATILFGFSRTFWYAFAARFLQGWVDGLVVMQKPALAMLSDETNAARAFATTGVAYGAASAFSPALAAVLAEPCTSWTRFRDAPETCPRFLSTYPFFLSNVWIVVFLSIPALGMYAMGMMDLSDRSQDTEDVVVELELLNEDGEADRDGDADKRGTKTLLPKNGKSSATENELPWYRDGNVKTAIGSSVGCTFVVLTGAEMTPLWMATSFADGGLGWKSVDIGLFGTVMGLTILAFQILVFTRLVRRFGIVSLLPIALMVNAVVFPLHAFAHQLAKHRAAWILVSILGFFRGMAGPIIMGGSSLILNNASPRRTLGAVNGFSGTFSNLARAVAPVLGGALIAMMIAMGPNAPGRTAWPFVIVGFGFVSLTIFSLKLPLELNKPRAR